MKALKNTNIVFKWIIFSLLVIILITLFCPIYENEIISDLLSVDATTFFYLYSSGYSNLFVILIAVLSIVFLFADFKSSKLFSFGLSATLVINNLFAIIMVNRLVEDQTSSRTSKYYLSYGYYLFMIETILLGLALILAIIFYAIYKSEDTKKDKLNGIGINLDDLKTRLDFLTELRDSEVITQSEYEQKRAEIIKKVNI